MSRGCGMCNACCTVFEIDELNKPSHSRCVHLVARPCTKSCSIYKDRPEPCRTYECPWKQGFGSSNHRPDKIGMLLQIAETNGQTVYVVYKLREEWSPKALALITRYSLRYPVVRAKKDGHALLGGPESAIRKMFAGAPQGAVDSLLSKAEGDA